MSVSHNGFEGIFTHPQGGHRGFLRSVGKGGAVAPGVDRSWQEERQGGGQVKLGVGPEGVHDEEKKAVTTPLWMRKGRGKGVTGFPNPYPAPASPTLVGCQGRC